VRSLNGQGKIVELMGLQTSVPGHDRHDGFVKGLGDAAIETIFSADMKWLQPDAQREMESALARFPRLTWSTATTTPAPTAPIWPPRRRAARRRCFLWA
jgi:ribose transport system substrate-binding protein